MKDAEEPTQRKDEVFRDREEKDWVDWETCLWVRKIVNPTRFDWEFYLVLYAAVVLVAIWRPGLSWLVEIIGFAALLGLASIIRAMSRTTRLQAECVRLLGLIHRAESEQAIADLKREPPREPSSTGAKTSRTPGRHSG